IAKNNIIPAGWLIEQIEGLKGKKIGGAMISEKHCNFIVNTGNAKAEDVVILISLIKQKIRSHFRVQLEEEIEYMGF
ncbi:MAG: UDP-N-acetylenolpyruvoylglucosamine reductase, partial [Candidatus Andersenbacteria bacterium]|nr:UDP-N-acetylenolpyruvoylglucosamine reductase [Candidatus Andersenbacteria bacterium]